ncbi:MAG: carboxypeptidase-like regulatory domain-containing protein [Gemmatimonadetes bacterium]|jgi:hypothetical protein|nr:carboxypeptidase-like regulatory domain-containing protein [Gemmatimonadota bacterium]
MGVRLVLASLFWIFSTVCTIQAQVLIRGFVRDVNTGEGLASATIQVKDTFSGTVANDDGEYVLQLDHLPATLVATCIGYRSQERIVADRSDVDVSFHLQAVPYVLEETIVSGEDPAVRIMRQVIEKKKEWYSRLENYQVDVYSRWTIENDTGVVGVVEIASDVYWDRARGTRELIKAKRTTDNIAHSRMFADFAAEDLFLNLYGDDVEVAGFRIIGPTHPRALRHFDFALVERKHLDDRVVHYIAASPRSPLQTAFAGTLAVVEPEFALLEVALRPTITTAALPSPALREFDLSYRQQFRSFGEGVWLPVDFRIGIDQVIGMPGLQIPSMKRTILQRMSDYRLNITLPDSLYVRKKSKQMDSLRVDREELFGHFRDSVPLSSSEREAYDRIDSTLTLEEAFRPTGFLARFIPQEEEEKEVTRWEELRAGIKPELWYNRVDAAHLGMGMDQKLDERFDVSLRGGYSTGQERWAYGGRFGVHQGEEETVRLGVEYQRGTQERYLSDSYSRGSNSLAMLMGNEDYFDYYWSTRRSIDLGLKIDAPELLLQARFSDERQASVDKSSRFDLLDRYDEYRVNPLIEAGDLRSATFTFNYGGDYVPWGLFPHRRLELQVEHSGDLLASDFSFTQYRLAFDWHVKTFYKRRLAPNAFDLRLVAGTATGELPVQRFGALDAGVEGFTPFGALRSLRALPYEGERYLGVFWEHNFKTVPFELLGLERLARRGIGLVVHGASGRTWISSDRREKLGYRPVYSDSFHHEAGISLILFHLWRLDLVRRLDRSAWRVGFSIARIDFDLGEEED